MQVSQRMARAGHRVTVIARHQLREHQFDSDPGWLGPKFMTRFKDEPKLERRRAMIQEARNRGSLPPKLMRSFRRNIEAGEIEFQVGEVQLLEDMDPDLQITTNSGLRLEVDRVLLATGYRNECPGGALIQNLNRHSKLKVSACGFPECDRHLRWHTRIFVSGGLGELELGPVARNIAGARQAAERIVACALHAKNLKSPGVHDS